MVRELLQLSRLVYKNWNETVQKSKWSHHRSVKQEETLPENLTAFLIMFFLICQKQCIQWWTHFINTGGSFFPVVGHFIVTFTELSIQNRTPFSILQYYKKTCNTGEISIHKLCLKILLVCGNITKLYRSQVASVNLCWA